METAIFICLFLVLAYAFAETMIKFARKGRIYKVRLTKDWIGNYYIECMKTPISMWYYFMQISADSDSEALEKFADFINKEKANNSHFKDTIICEKIIKEK